MVMLTSTLASALAQNPNTDSEAIAIQGFVNAWIQYFSTATAGLVPIVSPLLLGPIPAPQGAMIAAMTGLSTDGADVIASGISAFWTAMIPLATTLFPTATLLVAPTTLTLLPVALISVFEANTEGKLDATTCYQNIATVINSFNAVPPLAAGIATLTIAGVPTPLPII
jgi:hypothetical protein